MRISDQLPVMLTELVLASAANTAARNDRPFRHWRLRHILPASLAHALAELTVDVPAVSYAEGRREANNATRRFLNPAAQAQHNGFNTLAQAFQSPAVLESWERLTETKLAGNYLRIEYCQDMGGFWLEPHTDIGAKKFTLLIYLTDPPAGECWGTDLLYMDGTLAERAAGEANSAVLFIPGADTWHGFAPRPIHGVRKSVIINYVTDEWRAREQLAYPTSPVRA